MHRRSLTFLLLLFLVPVVSFVAEARDMKSMQACAAECNRQAVQWIMKKCNFTSPDIGTHQPFHDIPGSPGDLDCQSHHHSLLDYRNRHTTAQCTEACRVRYLQ